MEDQRRLQPQESSDFFADQVATRPLPDDVVRANASAINFRPPLKSILDSSDPRIATVGRTLDGDFESGNRTSVPEKLLKKLGASRLLARGQERFNISCSPCHDRTGSGNGMVPRRGFSFPPSYHTRRLRQQPLGYIFSVATRGRGKMPAYGDLISVDDRWAIAAYVRALQLSQYASLDHLSETDRQQLSNVSAPSRANPSKSP